jgi:hypothetical protein
MDWVAATLKTPDWFDPCYWDWKPGDPSGLDIAWEDPTYCNHPGSRGSTALWWRKYRSESWRLAQFIWAAFSVEQLRHMRPSCLELPGWLVAPRTRVAWLWGGPDAPAADGRAARVHGQPMRSPGNWSVFWTTCKPARPPVESIVIRTGV